MTDKAHMQMQLDQLLDQRRTLEKRVESAHKGYKLGMVAFLLGILLLFAYGLGLILLIPGLLAAVTQGAKKKAAQTELDKTENQIKDLRLRIANAS